MSKIRNHLKALSVPQLRALAIKRAGLKSPAVAAMSKVALVSVLRDVPNVLIPTVA
jgi:hypothetical protein